MKIGTRIKKILKFKGLTQKDLASGIGANECLISRWCKNITTPRVDKLEKIANFLEITLFELLGYCKTFDDLLAYDTNEFTC